MKIFAFILAIMFAIPLVNQAQDRQLEKLFNRYKNVKGFDYEKVGSSIEFDWDWDFGEFINNVKDIYILSFDNKVGNTNDLSSFISKFNKLMDKKDFKTLMDIGGEGKVQILLRKDKNGKATDYVVTTVGEEDAAFIWASSK